MALAEKYAVLEAADTESQYDFLGYKELIRIVRAIVGGATEKQSVTVF